MAEDAGPRRVQVTA